MTKYAIVGSCNFNNLGMVRDFVKIETDTVPAAKVLRLNRESAP